MTHISLLILVNLYLLWSDHLLYIFIKILFHDSWQSHNFGLWYPDSPSFDIILLDTS